MGQHGTIWTSDSPSVRVEGGKVYQSGGTNTESIPANRKDFRPSQWSVIGTLNTARNAPKLYLQKNIGGWIKENMISLVQKKAKQVGISPKRIILQLQHTFSCASNTKGNIFKLSKACSFFSNVTIIGCSVPIIWENRDQGMVIAMHCGSPFFFFFFEILCEFLDQGMVIVGLLFSLFLLSFLRYFGRFLTKVWSLWVPWVRHI